MKKEDPANAGRLKLEIEGSSADMAALILLQKVEFK